MPKALTLEEKKQRAEAKQQLRAESPAPQVRTEKQRDTRTSRIPIGVPRSKLTVSHQIPGYRLYWFNDVPGRVAEAEAGGYEFVTNEEVTLNDFVTSGNADLGTKVKRLVGKNEDGSALYAYLMKIKEEWFEEDQAALQAQVDKTDAAIRKGNITGIEQGYIPSSGISYKT